MTSFNFVKLPWEGKAAIQSRKQVQPKLGK